MAMWGYKIIPLAKGIEDVQNNLIHLGEDGWELICIINHPAPKQFYAEADTQFFAFLKKSLIRKASVR